MIAVIADDFTGAAEIAGRGWRHGLRAEILHRSEPLEAGRVAGCRLQVARSRLGSADLVVYDSDSRNCSPAEAGRRVARILRRLRGPLALGCRQSALYKKVDSVLRGNVVAEIEAALTALGLKRCLLAPANPSAGRIIRDGKYYIHGKPIHLTDFRNDPRHPRLTAQVADLIGGSKSVPVHVLRAGAKRLNDGINIGEAESFTDVQHWAEQADGQTLAAGGADFFRALLLKHAHCSEAAAKSSSSSLFSSSNTRVHPRSAHTGRTLFVSGSLTESSLDFLSRCRVKGWPVLLMPDELLAGGESGMACQARWARQVAQATRRHPKAVMGIGRPLLPGKGTPIRLGNVLIETVKRVLSAAQPDLVCVEGGATAALLLDRMVWRRLSVEIEYATGVAGARPHRRPEMLLVCKPGSYSWPEELSG